MRKIKELKVDFSSDDFWNLLKRNCSKSELIQLNRNIIACNGLKANDHRSTMISGLTSDEKMWNQHWVVIMNTFGLGYQTPQGILSVNEVNSYVESNHSDLNGFYLFWTLFFQYPYGKKHSTYYRNKKAVQPMVVVIQHLKLLFESAIFKGEDPFEAAYITVDEFSLVLTKIRSNNILDITESVSDIILNRENSFDYKLCYKSGEETTMSGLFSYVQKYYNLSPLIEFKDGKFKISSWKQYYQISSLLNLRNKPFLLESFSEKKKYNDYLSENINLADFYKGQFEYLENIGGRLDNMAETNLSDYITRNLHRRGVYFDKEFIETFILSLKTKPFLILSGISGVGKSLLPNMIMELSENDSCKPIAVAPNWVDNTDMLGYFDLEGNFIKGDFTRVVIDAIKNPSKPYFLILDEMNLAKVELYFAQVLSCIESRKLDTDLSKVIYKNPLFNKSYRDRFYEKSLQNIDDIEKEMYSTLSNLTIPNNLYIIGTVNIDESTHPFSKKVLDRANVIEINKVDLSIGLEFIEDIYTEESDLSNELIDDEEPQEVDESATDLHEDMVIESSNGEEEQEVEDIEDIVIVNSMLEGKITNFKELVDIWSRDIELLRVLPLKLTIEKWIEELENFNSCLIGLKQNFGLRVRDEVCIYLYHSARLNYTEIQVNENWWYKYFDQQLMQKILTRVEGESEEILEVLKNLFNFCMVSDYEINEITANKFNIEEFKYPNAAMKIKGMLLDIVKLDKPATSFWSV
ncbi:hypothetical protein ABR330_07310 [Bacillus cabrialesii subsp. cabrialesii]